MGHTYSNLLVHVIFSTKNRKPLLHESLRDRLYAYMAGIARQEFGYALKIGGTDNHIHALLRLGTDTSVGHAMMRWKSLSSGWVHRTFQEARDFAWQAGYAVFSVSKSSVPDVVGYIGNQAQHHKTQTFEEEFVAFLRRHGVDFDPKRIWE